MTYPCCPNLAKQTEALLRDTKLIALGHNNDSA